MTDCCAGYRWWRIRLCARVGHATHARSHSGAGDARSATCARPFSAACGISPRIWRSRIPHTPRRRSDRIPTGLTALDSPGLSNVSLPDLRRDRRRKHPGGRLQGRGADPQIRSPRFRGTVEREGAGAVSGRRRSPRAEHPVIGLDRNGDLAQIAYNNYDRAPFRLPGPRMAAFYRALKLFNQLINDPSNEITMRLAPGTALLFDNWRTLHGRRAYRVSPAVRRVLEQGRLRQQTARAQGARRDAPWSPMARRR